MVEGWVRQIGPHGHLDRRRFTRRSSQAWRCGSSSDLPRAAQLEDFVVLAQANVPVPIISPRSGRLYCSAHVSLPCRAPIGHHGVGEEQGESPCEHGLPRRSVGVGVAGLMAARRRSSARRGGGRDNSPRAQTACCHERRRRSMHNVMYQSLSSLSLLIILRPRLAGGPGRPGSRAWAEGRYAAPSRTSSIMSHSCARTRGQLTHPLPVWRQGRPATSHPR